jgi:hypothetical protein
MKIPASIVRGVNASVLSFPIDLKLSCQLPDWNPIVDDDLDPAAEPEPEVKNSGVFFCLRETLAAKFRKTFFPRH